MKTMFKSLSLALTTFAVIAAGCSPGGGVDESLKSLSFNVSQMNWTETKVYNNADDVSALIDGIQIDVFITATGYSDGTTLTLQSGASVATGQVSDGQGLFPEVTMPDGQTTLRVTTSDYQAGSACDGINCAELLVTALESGCYIVSPATGSILTTDQYPDPDSVFDPFEVDVTIGCFNFTSGTAALSINGTQVASQSVSGSSVFSKVALSTGTNTISLATINSEGTELTSVSSVVTVQQPDTVCDVTVTHEGDGVPLTSADDIDPAAGLQTPFTVTTSCIAATATVELYAGEGLDPNGYSRVDTGATVTSEISGENRVFTVSPATLVDGVWNVCARVLESGDNPKSGEGCYVVPVSAGSIVDATPPSISNANFRDEDNCVGGDNNGDQSDGLQTNITLQVTPSETGVTYNIRVLDGTGTPTACTSAADCLGDQSCVTWPGEDTDSCTYVETDPPAGTPELDLPLPDGAVEVFACDSVGNCSSSSVYNYRSYEGVALSGSVTVTPVVESIENSQGVSQDYMNLQTEIVCSGDSVSNPAACDSLQLSAGQEVKLQTVRVTVAGRLPGSIVALDVNDVEVGTKVLTDSDITAGVATVDFYLTLEDGSRRFEASVTDAAATEGCAPRLDSAPVDVTVDTSRMTADAQALNMLGEQFTTANIACIGPFQDLDLSIGPNDPLSNSGLSNNDLEDGLQVSLTVQLADSDVGQLLFAFASAQTGTCSADSDCGGGACVDAQCYESVDILGSTLVQSGDITIPAGTSGRNDTLRYLLRDSAGNLSGALQDPFTPYTFAFGKVFDAIPSLAISAPAALSADSGGSASLTITKGTEWDTIGSGAGVQIFKDAATTDVATTTGADGGTLNVGRRGSGTLAGELSSSGTIQATGLSEGITGFLAVMRDPCAADLGNNDPYLIYANPVSTIVRSDVTFTADLKAGSRTLVDGDKTSASSATVEVTTSAVTQEQFDANVYPQFAVYRGSRAGGACSYTGSPTATTESGVGVTSNSLSVNLASGAESCIKVRYADGINGSLNDDVAGFFAEWAVTRVQASEVPQCSIESPNDGAVAVDADDAANGFQFAPSLTVTGDSAAFEFGTTVATVEVREGGVTGSLLASGQITLDVTTAGSLAVSGLPDLTYGQSYGLVATCTTTLAETDVITGDADGHAFSVPTNLDFPVSVPTSIEGRYQAANVPTSVILTKSPDATISDCTIAVNSAAPSPFVWPSTGGVQDLSVTRALDGVDTLSAGQAKLTFVCNQGGVPGKPIYRYFFVDDNAPVETAVTWASQLADGSATSGDFTGATPTVGSSALSLTLDMNEAVESLGSVGDTTTLLEADDEERSSRPEVGTDTYAVSAVVTDAAGTQLSAVNGTVTSVDSSPTLVLDLGTTTGAASISVTVTDEAGNALALGPYTVNVDLDAPTIAITDPDGLVEVVDGVVPSSRPIYTDADDSSTLLNGMQLRYTFSTSGTDGTETVTYSVTRGGVETASGTLSLNGSQTVTSAHTNTDDSLDSDDATVDAPYLITASVSDSVGNTASVTYAFDVFNNVPSIAWAPAPDSLLSGEDDLTAGGELQTQFFHNGTGFYSNGGAVKLCVARTDNAAVVIDGVTLSEACAVGLNVAPSALGGSAFFASTSADTNGAVMRGVVLQTQTTSTDRNALITLPDGEYFLHFEGDRTADLGVDLGFAWTGFAKVAVDTTSPSSESFTFTVDDSIVLDAGPSATRDNTVVLTLTQPAENAETLGSFSVFTDNPTPNTPLSCASSPTLSANPVTCTVTLADGSHNVSAQFEDANGNAGQASLATTILVDTQAGAATMGLPIVGTVVASDVSGAALETGEAWQKATLAGITISADGTDPTLSGGKLIVDVYAADGNDGTRAFDSCVINLTGDTLSALQASNEITVTTCADGSTFQIPQGVGFARVSFEDAVGNTNVPGSGWRETRADFVAPSISVFQVASAAGTADASCNTHPGCVPDLEDLGAGAYQEAGTLSVYLDVDASTACPSEYETALTGTFGEVCNNAGTDFQIRVDDCVAATFAGTVESCSASSSNVALVTRVNNNNDSSAAFTVLTETPAAGDITGAFDNQRSVFGDPLAVASAVGIAPGLVREFQLVAVDDNNNQVTSSSVFLHTYSSGVTAEIVAVAGSGSTQTLTNNGFLNGTYLSEVDGSTSTANLRVNVTAQGGENVTAMTLTNPDGSTTNATSVTDNGGGSYSADFNTVAFTTVAEADGATTNNVSVSIVCDGSACGSLALTGITADGSALTWQWDRHSLCELNVPLSDSSICDSQAAADAETATPTAGGNIAGTAANWNKTLDTNAATSAFDLSAVRPLIAKISGLNANANVTLTVTSGSVGGTATVETTGCPADCTATFAGVNFASLADDGTYTISISATDTAGNTAVPLSTRTTDATESVVAAVDTVAPTAPTFSVCVGDTTVASNSVFEDVAACSAACTATNTCSRLGGKATLTFTAPSDDGDGSGAGTVATYTAYALARGFSYAGDATDTFSACPTGTTLIDNAENAVSVTDSAVAPGGTVNLAFDGLFPHRDYCFVLTSADTSANAATSAMVERSFALANQAGTSVAATSFDATDTIGARDSVDGLAKQVASFASFSDGKLVGLSDFDGDGLEDFMVWRNNNQTDGANDRFANINLYLSSGDPTTPILIQTGPTTNARMRLMGQNFLSSGDVNGDGLSDIVIGWHNAAGAGGTQSNAGAVFVYLGQATSTGWSTVTNSDDWLPSITPSITIYGDGTNVKLAEYGAVGDFVSGNGRDEIAVKASGSVHVFDIGSLAAGTNTTVDLTGGSGLASTAFVGVKSNGLSDSLYFARGSIYAADVDGDGTDELVIGDSRTVHDGLADSDTNCPSSSGSDCGEIYVYAVGAATGDLGSPDTSPAALKHTLRGVSDNETFGQTIGVLKAPNAPGGDNADWILVETGSTDSFYVFKGSTSGGGIVPAQYPVPGSGPNVAGDYTRLGPDLRGNNDAYAATAFSLGNLDGTNPHYLIPGNTVTSARVFRVESGSIIDVMSLDCESAAACGMAAYGSPNSTTKMGILIEASDGTFSVLGLQ